MPVIDASVWVSICHAGDRHHRRSTEWLASALEEGTALLAPTLLSVEVAAAVRRLTGDRALALAATTTVEELDAVELVPLTPHRAERAAALAATAGVRGADAVYLELARDRGDVLVTWDRQQLERGAEVVRCMQP